MARTTSISLSDHCVDFIDTQMATGRYGSVSEVVCAGLRMLEMREQRVRALQEALKAGEESGVAAPFDGEAFLRRMKTTHAR